ncbi:MULTISPECIES: hypothetical protein [Kordiimonas]|jgi:DMSO/TMAO reductase YedYZ molybdopterin-dependent catalytic subunit|uniref:hypothetical protein n=1 Tax=Kordiimonas TaxID=288021 RepID=UPI00258055C0|nr:hypothetical protein [Kordiimonas sp. UBA4487]
MTIAANRFSTKWTAVAGISAALVLAGCGASQQATPEQVAASNPTVAYEYKSDRELIQANQRSVAFCEQYGSIPITARYDTATDGAKTIYFECTPKTAEARPLPDYVPNLAIDYRTDRELMAATHNAEIYCMNSGASQVAYDLVVNADGTRTVVFQCVSG